VSLRSSGDPDVREIAARLGGGGHHAAAGIVLHTAVPEARRLVLDAVSEYFGARD